MMGRGEEIGWSEQGSTLIMSVRDPRTLSS